MFECKKCFKKFNNKIEYERHLNRKKDCFFDNEIEKIYECNFCDKKYAHINNLYRHQKTCDKKNNNKKSLIKTNSNIVNNTNDNNENLMKLFEKLIDQNTKIIDSIGFNNNKITNTNNNNNNSHNTTNNTTNNTFNNLINIHSYKETRKQLLTNFPVRLLNDSIKNIIKGIPLLVKYVHYNKKKPENMNIKGKGLTSNYLLIYNGKKYVYRNKIELIQSLIVDKKDILDTYFDIKVDNNQISGPKQYHYNECSDKLDKVLNSFRTKQKPNEEEIKLYQELFDNINILINNDGTLNADEDNDSYNGDEDIMYELEEIDEFEESDEEHIENENIEEIEPVPIFINNNSEELFNEEEKKLALERLKKLKSNIEKINKK
jgi:hypothetical protein